MPAIDPTLGDFVTRDEFAAMLRRSPRTVSRWLAQPRGLPHLVLGNRVLISVPDARAWLAGQIRQPNPPRK